MASNAESPAELSPRSTDLVDEPDKSDLFLSVLSKMQSSLDNNNALLANLFEKSSQLTSRNVHDTFDIYEPHAKRLRHECSSDLDHSLATSAVQAAVDPAAQSAQYPAAQSAQAPAAQSAHSSAAQSAITPAAQSPHTLTAQSELATAPAQPGDQVNDQLHTVEYIRSAEEDAVSLFGGPEFEQQDQHPALDNASLLESIDSSLLLTDEAGPPLSEKLAHILNSKFQAEFDPGKRKELLSKYKVPSNCENFYVPKVNPEIWQKLGGHAKRCDMAIYIQQDTLLRVTSALSSVVDGLLSARQKNEVPDYHTLISQIIDSVALLGHVSKELSFKRRDLLRPVLSVDFKQACSRNMKMGKFLFGDDLGQVIQQIRSTSRLLSNVANTPNQARLRPSGYPTSNSFSRYPFLGQRGRMNWPPRYNLTQHRAQHRATRGRKATRN